MSTPAGIFLNNALRQSIDGSIFRIEDPRTGCEVIRIYEGRENDVDEAVSAAARQDFISKELVGYCPTMRGELPQKLALLMERVKEDLVAIEILDTGKTYKQASGLDFMGFIGRWSIMRVGPTRSWA